MDAASPKSAVVPFSLRDTPSLIERVWPAQKISVETQKERKAGAGQTLTALGSYWKGRKPLFLVRACILAALLPATGDDEKDLAIFELLVGMGDDQIDIRSRTALSAQEVQKYGTPAQCAALLDPDDNKQIKKLPKVDRSRLMAGVIARMPYQERLEKLLRPEEVQEDLLTGPYLARVNNHLGTTATTLHELVEELGIMRFGRRPIISDTFSGGGSIPFEAARLGCDTNAADLNPIACMLTWGALNVIGAAPAERDAIAKLRQSVLGKVDAEVTRLGIEHDADGNRAKAFLYCTEVRCPHTGWSVPVSPSWVVSTNRKTIAVLVPDRAKQRFNIQIRSDVSDDELEAAAKGTVQDGRLTYSLDGEVYVTPIKTIRGDRRGSDGETVTDLRRWEKQDFRPQPGDIFQERLYCIQWITKETLGHGRQATFFAAPTDDDMRREEKVEQIVRKNLAAWQERGLVPDLLIEPGDETSRLMRERGWTYWHHLFNARGLLYGALAQQHAAGAPPLCINICDVVDRLSKLCRWDPRNAASKRDPTCQSTFYNQALNTIFNYGTRSWAYVSSSAFDEPPRSRIYGQTTVSCDSAESFHVGSDIFVTDPPYADAVAYHEITEFFIAWLRKRPPAPFNRWTWDSRRPLAIKGEGEEFRRSMVQSYDAMAKHMPENGLQILMFTHQSASVWADMAQIFWGAGLQVMAAWYIATETSSELKKGGYVQGTVILVLRKRRSDASGYKDEIVQEVRAEVAQQIDTMVGLNQTLRGHGRIENLFEDADLQMAGYAAALRVLTSYAKIDGVDMTKEALRARRSGDVNLVGEIIDFAVQVANEHMVPEHMQPHLWETLTGAERFYFKMMDIETTSLRKLDNYQNFAKAFRVPDYTGLMGNLQPNKARLKSAKEFKKTGFETSEFGPSATRAALYAIYELENEVEGDEVLSHLRDMVPSYHSKRDDLASIAEYIARKREKVDETESRAARILHGLIRNERLG
ncbi:anti-phage-associated DUF1156 domain-containing protein [Bradyrhizobium sp. USDA 4353]